MLFLWPEMLWLALMLPVLLLLYLWLLRRRKREAIRYPNLGLLRAAMGKIGWRRHLPPALMLAALSALVMAGSRPMARLTLLSSQQTVILAMDVSLSMSGADIAPNRLTASQVAAKTFAEQLPRNVRVGVVAYGGSAHLVQPATLSRDDVIAAIDRFQLQRATAIGLGILASLQAIFPEEDFDFANATRERSGRPLTDNDGRATARGRAFPPVAPGSYQSAVIILLTDGQNTTGPSPMEAAQVAADRGVKVYTVGFGTAEGTLLDFGGMKMRVRLDEEAMKQVANLTGGKYFNAGTTGDLIKVYDALKARLVLENKEVEITALFALFGAFLVLLSAGLSIGWFGKVG